MTNTWSPKTYVNDPASWPSVGRIWQHDVLWHVMRIAHLWSKRYIVLAASNLTRVADLQNYTNRGPETRYHCCGSCSDAIGGNTHTARWVSKYVIASAAITITADWLSIGTCVIKKGCVVFL